MPILRLVLVAIALQLGCGVALVNNPKRSGLDCSRTRVLPAIDLLLAGAGTAVLFQQGTATDEPVTLTAPAVLVASALWGSVKVGRCKRAWENATPEQIATFHRERAERRQREEEQRRIDAERRRETAIAAAAAAAEAEAHAAATKPAPDQVEPGYTPEPPPTAPASPPAPPPEIKVTVESYRLNQACVPVSKTNTCGAMAICDSFDDVDPSNHGFCMIPCNVGRSCPKLGGRQLQCTLTPLTNRQGRTLEREVCR